MKKEKSIVCSHNSSIRSFKNSKFDRNTSREPFNFQEEQSQYIQVDPDNLWFENEKKQIPKNLSIQSGQQSFSNVQDQSLISFNIQKRNDQITDQVKEDLQHRKNSQNTQDLILSNKQESHHRSSQGLIDRYSWQNELSNKGGDKNQLSMRRQQKIQYNRNIIEKAQGPIDLQINQEQLINQACQNNKQKLEQLVRNNQLDNDTYQSGGSLMQINSNINIKLMQDDSRIYEACEYSLVMEDKRLFQISQFNFDPISTTFLNKQQKKRPKIIQNDPLLGQKYPQKINESHNPQNIINHQAEILIPDLNQSQLDNFKELQEIQLSQNDNTKIDQSAQINTQRKQYTVNDMKLMLSQDELRQLEKQFANGEFMEKIQIQKLVLNNVEKSIGFLQMNEPLIYKFLKKIFYNDFKLFFGFRQIKSKDKNKQREVIFDQSLSKTYYNLKLIQKKINVKKFTQLNWRLRNFRFEGINLTYNDKLLFFNCISNFEKLNLLSLQNDNIGDEGLKIMLKYFQRGSCCKFLEFLILGFNKITDNGFIPLTESKVFEFLFELRMTKNLITNKGFISFAANSSSFPSLLTIDLAENQIDTIEQNDFFQMMKQSKLSIINLRSNPLLNQSYINIIFGYQRLKKKLPKKPNVYINPQSLSNLCSETQIYQEQRQAFRQFWKWLQHNYQKLKQLDMSNCRIYSEGFSLLMKSLTFFGQLSSLKLNKNCIETIIPNDIKMTLAILAKRPEPKLQISLVENKLSHKSKNFLTSLNSEKLSIITSTLDQYITKQDPNTILQKFKIKLVQIFEVINDNKRHQKKLQNLFRQFFNQIYKYTVEFRIIGVKQIQQMGKKAQRLSQKRLPSEYRKIFEELVNFIEQTCGNWEYSIKKRQLKGLQPLSHDRIKKLVQDQYVQKEEVHKKKKY